MKYKMILLVLVGYSWIYGQELDLDVKVVVQGNTTSDPKIAKTLESAIFEFVNSTKWTEDSYESFERIKGSLQLTIVSEPLPGNFTAELVIKSERPVYQSTYRSPMLLLIDKHISFPFTGINPVVKTTTIYVDNLSSILSYYAYLIIGLDRDSFSPYGGEEAFLRAQEIINTIGLGATGDEGWNNDNGSKRNRYWYINNILHPRMRPYRQSVYEYHRICLDKMTGDLEKARAILLSTLTSIGQVELDYPSTMLIQVFGDTKKDEIIEIFKIADRGSKSKVKTIMVGMDASKKDKYNVLN